MRAGFSALGISGREAKGLLIYMCVIGVYVCKEMAEHSLLGRLDKLDTHDITWKISSNFRE